MKWELLLVILLLPAFVQAQVDVYGVRAENGLVWGFLKNLGPESAVGYHFEINGVRVWEGQVELGENQSQRVEFPYYFSPGRYRIKLSAGEDYEEIILVMLQEIECQSPPGWEGQEICQPDGIYRCESGSWKKLEVSEEEFCRRCGCEGEAERACGIFFSSYEWIEKAVENQPVRIGFEIASLQPQEVSVELYLNGSLNQTESFWVEDKKESSFELSLPPGTYQIEVRARSSCGSDSFGFLLDVSPFKHQEIPEEEVQEEAKPKPETAVELEPEEIEMALGQTRVIRLDITSHQPQYFRIEVSPAEIAAWQERVWIEESGTVYIYLLPKEMGSFDLEIEVRAESEKKDFRFEIKVYVGKELEKLGFLGKFLYGIQKLQGMLESRPEMMAGMIFLMFLGALVSGFAILREERIW